MSTIELLRAIVGLALSGVLTWAAISDVRQRRIPNHSVLAVLVLFVPWAACGGISLASAVSAAAVAFAVTYVMFAAGLVGAGDAKLFSVLALFTGLAQLPALAFITVIVGGVIAAASLLLRPTRAAVMLQMRGAGNFGRGIPYGVAIALAGSILVASKLTGIGHT